jgi:hypothetical protein
VPFPLKKDGVKSSERIRPKKETLGCSRASCPAPNVRENLSRALGPLPASASCSRHMSGTDGMDSGLFGATRHACCALRDGTNWPTACFAARQAMGSPQSLRLGKYR